MTTKHAAEASAEAPAQIPAQIMEHSAEHSAQTTNEATAPKPAPKKRKRGQNEGSIYKRKDGRWVAQVSVGYANGKRTRKYLYGDTRAEVARQLTKVQRDVQQGLPVAMGKSTVEAFLTRWLEDVVKVTLSPTTYVAYKGRVKLHLAPALGKIAIDKLTVRDVQRFVAQQAAKGLKRNTIDGQITTLKAALTVAMRDNLIGRNVATLVDLPPVDEKEKAALTADEAKRFLTAARRSQQGNLFAVLLTTGLRISEARGLTWGDVDTSAGTLTVRRQIVRHAGANVTRPPKSASGVRTVALASLAVAALVRQREQIADARTTAGAQWQDSGLIFPGATGTPFAYSAVREALDRVCLWAKLPAMGAHALRHTAATFMAEANVNPRIAMDALGHSTPMLTLARYQHVTNTMRATVAGAMESLLSGDEKGAE